jgi:hypothetical protein
MNVLKKKQFQSINSLLKKKILNNNKKNSILFQKLKKWSKSQEDNQNITKKSIETFIKILTREKNVSKEKIDLVHSTFHQIQSNKLFILEKKKSIKTKDNFWKIILTIFMGLLAMYICHYHLGMFGLFCGLFSTFLYSPTFYIHYPKAFMIISLSSFVVGSLLGSHFFKEFNFANILKVALSSPILTMALAHSTMILLRFFKIDRTQSLNLLLHFALYLPVVIFNAVCFGVVFYTICLLFKKKNNDSLKENSTEKSN